jgi:glucose-1-phosphate adenylyltransferase
VIAPHIDPFPRRFFDLLHLLPAAPHPQDTIVFGADNLDSSAGRQAELASGTIPLGVGEGSKLQKAIIDSNARIGRGVSLTNKAGVQDGANSALPKGVVIRDGILVVMRGAVVPDGTVV